MQKIICAVLAATAALAAAADGSNPFRKPHFLILNLYVRYYERAK